MENAHAFTNCSFFFLPFLVREQEKLASFLHNGNGWKEKTGKVLDTSYILHYASRMTEPEDARLRRYDYVSPADLPLYTFDARIAAVMQEEGKPWSGLAPALDGISLFVFGTGVGFLEFRISYGEMPVEEIMEFIFLFRSLRNDEKRGEYLLFPEDRVSVQTAADRILPPAETGTQLCFSNDSEIKKQANVFTILKMDACGVNAADEKEIDRCRYFLMHGFHSRFGYAKNRAAHAAEGSGNEDLSTQYEMVYNAGDQSYWGGSQDGIVCLAREPYAFQYDHLVNDYRFQYLLLLNQRFSSIACIGEFSEPLTKLAEIQNVHKKVADLKTRYSFRVVSDDHYNQTIYSKMYDVLELDNLIADLEDTKDQLNDVTQAEQNKHDRRFEGLLTALSLLAIFSALVDLSDYLDRFFTHTPGNSWISLIVNLGIIGVALYLIFSNRRRK